MEEITRIPDMAYATPDDLITLFGQQEMVQLTNLDRPGAQGIDEERLEAAIAYSDSLIDSFLTAQIPIPVPDNDNYAQLKIILKGKTLDITRYVLESRGEPRPDVKMRYDMAIAWLQSVSKGEIQLIASTSSDDAPMRFGVEQARTYTKDSLAGFTDPWWRSV